MPTLLSKRRFTIDDGVDLTTVTPVNSGLKYRWQLEEGTRFYRKKLTTKLLFKKADYTFFKALYDLGTCNDIVLTIEVYCGGEWSIEYTGRIIISDGDYHLDRCEVTYQILPNDLYECMARALKTPLNFLDYGTKMTMQTIFGTVETTTCTYNDVEFGLPTLKQFFKSCWFGGTQSINIGFTPEADVAWRPIVHNQDFDTPVADQLQLVTTWARETVNYPGGPPPGNGWYNTTGDTWVRPVLYGKVIQDEFRYTPVDQYNFEAEVVDVDISNGRLLSEVITAALAALGCEIVDVRSDFLNINPPGTAPSNAAYDWATDYAQTLLIFQKSDIVRASATADAIRLTLTLGDLLKALQDSLNVYWALEPDGADFVLRIEHWSYFDGNNGTDLTTLDGGKYIVGTNQFSAEGSIPALEKFSYQESFADDFLGKQIEYPQACSDSDNVIDYSLSQMCADVGGLLDNTDAGLTGFVLVSAFEIDTNTYLIDNTNDEANGAMAWRVLFPALWAYGRYGPEATTTAGAFTVETVRKRKTQPPIKFKYCCDNGEPNPTELIQTGLGWGQVAGMELDTERDTMTVNLLH